MTDGDYEIDTIDDDGPLPRARALMLRDMSLFIEWVEADATARRAVIAADEARCGIAAWLDIYEAGRDACLVIEARLAAEAALSIILASDNYPDPG